MLLEIQNTGFTVDDYLAAVRNYRSVIRALYSQAQPERDHVDRLNTAARTCGIAGVTLMTEDWCGDSACNVPIVARLCQAAEIPFHVVRGSDLPALKKRYESTGDDHIPVVSVWGADGQELARWVEAPRRVQEKKEAWKAERPEFMELYARQRAGDGDAAKAFGALYREFLETMAGWYREDGLWAETTRELVERVEDQEDQK